MSVLGASLGFDDMTLGAPRTAREALARGAITVESLRTLHRLRDSRSCLDAATTLLSFAAVPLLYWMAPHPLTALVCVLLAIRNFNSAAQLVHESDHGTLFRDTRWNVAVGTFCATLLGYTRSGHRQTHMNHHLHLNTARDPDIIFSQPDRPGREILVGLLQDLLLISAIKRFLQYFQPSREPYSVEPWRRLTSRSFVEMARALVPVALTQLALLLLFALTVGARWYLLFHVLPLMTLYPLQMRVRSVAEHSFEHGDRPPTDQDAWVTRSSRLGPLERLIVAPLGQWLHYEHHVFPAVPNYNLRQAHRLLVAAGIPVPTNRSYFGFVCRRIRTQWNG